MNDVLKCTYSDLKTVKTRSVCQLILEMPIEALTDVVGLLGAPVPGNEVWVAVARLRTGTDKPPAELEAPRPAAKLSQIAGICCNEGGFRRFIEERTGHEIPDAESAAKFVRLACAVKSRADLDRDAKAAQLWRNLKGAYDLWLRDEAA